MRSGSRVDIESARGPDPVGVRAFPFSRSAAFLAAPESAQRAALLALAAGDREVWLRLLEDDPRAGRRRLASSLRRQEQRRERRELRWRELSEFDSRLGEASGLLLAGVDEVGRGPLAGPVTAGALVLPPGYRAEGLDDSKRLSAAERELWASRLRRDAVAWAVADVAAETIDEIGIRRATLRAMGAALQGLGREPGRVLVDGRDALPGLPSSLAVVGGDARSLSIAGASVIAKVHRDSLMADMDSSWPGYGFARNKGYGSEDHALAIVRLGPCPIHRRSFCGRWIGRERSERRDGPAR